MIVDTSGVEDRSTSKVEPGDYTFKVDDIQEKNFKSGSSGLSVKLLAGVGDRDVTVYDTVVVEPAAGKNNTIWRLKALAGALGFDAENIDTNKLLGKFGRASFKLEDGYLRVDRYEKADTPDTSIGKPVPKDDDVPF